MSSNDAFPIEILFMNRNLSRDINFGHLSPIPSKREIVSKILSTIGAHVRSKLILRSPYNAKPMDYISMCKFEEIKKRTLNSEVEHWIEKL